MKHHVLSFTVLLLLVVLGVVSSVRDPYTHIQAESADVDHGARVDDNYYLYAIATGDHVGFNQLNFSAETVAFEWRIYNNNDYDPSHQVSLRLDSPTTPPFLNHSIPNSNGHWLTSTAWIPADKRPRGVHDLYFTFINAGGLIFDWFRFVSLESLLPPSTTLCKDAKAIDCPTPPPTTSPPLTTCPPPDDVHVTSSEPRVSMEQCDNASQTHNHINIYVN